MFSFVIGLDAWLQVSVNPKLTSSSLALVLPRHGRLRHPLPCLARPRRPRRQERGGGGDGGRGLRLLGFPQWPPRLLPLHVACQVTFLRFDFCNVDFLKLLFVQCSFSSNTGFASAMAFSPTSSRPPRFAKPTHPPHPTLTLALEVIMVMKSQIGLC